MKATVAETIDFAQNIQTILEEDVSYEALLSILNVCILYREIAGDNEGLLDLLIQQIRAQVSIYEKFIFKKRPNSE